MHAVMLRLYYKIELVTTQKSNDIDSKTFAIESRAHVITAPCWYISLIRKPWKRAKD